AECGILCDLLQLLGGLAFEVGNVSLWIFRLALHLAGIPARFTPFGRAGRVTGGATILAGFQGADGHFTPTRGLRTVNIARLSLMSVNSSVAISVSSVSSSAILLTTQHGGKPANSRILAP